MWGYVIDFPQDIGILMFNKLLRELLQPFSIANVLLVSDPDKGKSLHGREN